MHWLKGWHVVSDFSRTGYSGSRRPGRNQFLVERRHAGRSWLERPRSGVEQGDQCDDRKHGGREEGIAIIAKSIEDPAGDPRSQNACGAPRREQHAVIQSQVTRAIKISSGGREERQLRAITPVDE